MKYTILIEKGKSSWGAHVPDLPGCVAVGESREKVLKHIRKAIALHLEALRNDGNSIPLPFSEADTIEIESF